jgi:sirohydrochlorin ferrochelatase
MRSLLLVAHGSRRETSNDEVRGIAAALAEQAGRRFEHVGYAFLEILAPTIGDGIEAALRAGASEVVVLPYFLSAGRHVAEDIPAAVERTRRSHPGARIRIAPHLGRAPGLTETLLDLADSSSDPL